MFNMFASVEPDELRQRYIAVPDQQRLLHGGSTTTALAGQWAQLASGILVPVGADLGASPLDNIGTFLTGEELFGSPMSTSLIEYYVRQVSRDEILLVCATALSKVAGKRDEERAEARVFAEMLVEPRKTRATSLIERGRVIYTREAVLALAKLAIAYGAETHTAELPLPALVPLMLIGIHDVFSSVSPDFAQPAPGVFSAELVAFLTANQALHRTVDVSTLLASYGARWGNPGDSRMMEVSNAFEAELGFAVKEQAAFALACWSLVEAQGGRIFERSWLRALGFDPDHIELILAENAISIADADAAIRKNELTGGAFNWNFDTFERYPIIKIADDRYLILDTDLLLTKAFGWNPLYQLCGKTGQRNQTFEGHLEHNAEEYALAILDQMYGQTTPSRLFVEAELQEMKPGAKCADAAIDFGARWVVLDVTAARVPRNVLLGNPEGTDHLLAMVVRKLEQVASTAQLLTTHRRILTGAEDLYPIKIYPVVVMAEGYTANPVTLSEVRRLVAETDWFDGLNVAPIELFDLAELEMVETLAETGGPSLPDLVEAKGISSFWADSMRNYLISTGLLTKPLPDRAQKAQDNTLRELAALFGADVEERWNAAHPGD